MLPIGTAVGGAGNLNRYGPQSTRPLPRWYWWSNSQKRWRRFDNVDTGMDRNTTIEQVSERTQKGLAPGLKLKWPNGGSITIVEWDYANRRGKFKWKESATATFMFERMSQRESAEIQANNFVYDHSGFADPDESMLADNAHVVPMFRDMLNRELDHAKTHVFMYHSYHNVSLIYDLGACLMRVAFPEEATEKKRDALVLRTDRSTFNNRGVYEVRDLFYAWYNGTDVGFFNPPDRQFPWIGVSTVLNCFKPNPESTVVRDFKTGYNPGDSPNLNPVLDNLLKEFDIAKLKDTLLQYTIEADVDVTSFLGTRSHFFQRQSSTDPWELSPLNDEYLERFEDFMAHDNELAAEGTIFDWTASLRRDGPGLQAYGEAVAGNDGRKLQLLTVSTNAGRYLQIGIPLQLVDQLAYAALPFGLSDPNPKNALSQMDKREDLSDGGQARLIARPDLLWRPDVLQKVYQFSRGAADKRLAYLQKMEALLRSTLGPGGLVSVARKLRPPPIVVRSHNVKHDNATMNKIVEGLSSAAIYDFACLQETTDTMLSDLKSALPPSYYLLYDHACDAKKVYAAMAYRAERFVLLGDPFYGCFKLKSNKEQGGRPVVGAIFDDKWVGRRILVLSIHAPHNSKEPYSLMPNLKYFVKMTLQKSGVAWAGESGVAHVVIGGDFNREDWTKPRALHAPNDLELHSAQGLNAPLLPTISGKAFDNILFGSREFRYTLELKSFYTEKETRGSDHNAVAAWFLC